MPQDGDPRVWEFMQTLKGGHVPEPASGMSAAEARAIECHENYLRDVVFAEPKPSGRAVLGHGRAKRGRR